MSKKDMVAFRGSARGYNKADVNKYIEDMNKEIIEIQSTKNESTAALDEANRRLGELLDSFNKLSAEHTETQNALAEKEAEYKKLLDDTADSREHKEQLEELVETLTMANELLKERNAALEEKLDSAEPYYEKARLYEKLTAKIKGDKKLSGLFFKHSGK